MRLRALETRAVFNRAAVAFHYKPPPSGLAVDALLRQVRAQARTAVQLERKHPHWRVALAIGDTPPQRWLGTAVTRSRVARLIEPLVGRSAGEPLDPLRRAGAALLATDAYYEELLRARTAGKD